MKINACFEVVVEMEVDDKFEILTAEPVEELMDELEKFIEKNSPYDTLKIIDGYYEPKGGDHLLVGVYSADEGLAMLEY